MTGAASPWPVASVVQIAVGQGLCLGFIALAAALSASEPFVDDQRLWVILSVVAVIASGAANSAALVGGRRAVARRRVDLFARSEDRWTPPLNGSDVPPPAEHLVTIPGMTLVHRPDCALVAGKTTTPAGQGVPCGWCQP